jgi:lipopolysaccharide/colanic/teichoic acid biosynthesis glycosyltransferase
MTKRLLDVAISAIGLLLSLPVLAPVLFLVWAQDRRSPFYVAKRVGKGGKHFRLVKIRSMVVGADRSGVDSTSAGDPRITPLGRWVRAYKLDELPQLWNVLRGEMSLVGPRPNVQRDVDLYTDLEMRLLSVKPGITDLSSIVFSDENEILRGSPDPDLEYNRLIRPWKSRLGLFYLDHRSTILDLQLIALTAMAMVSRKAALRGLERILLVRRAEGSLIEAAARRGPLVPYPPPGSAEILTTRTLARSRAG